MKMRFKNTILCFAVLVVLLSSCIEEYIPSFDSIESQKYVISGLLTDQEGFHEVSISLVSSINNPKKTPLDGCAIKLVDNKGNSFSYDEYKSGYYRTWIAKSYLSIGTLYKLEITTPAGVNLVSDFEEMKECPSIDTVYFIREDLPTNNTEVFTEGIQFYLDIDASNIETNFFKFDIVETWEYHAMYPIELYFDGTMHQLSPPDYSNNICWKTNKVKNIFLLNTTNLAVNKYIKLPLHFVSNRTSRLSIIYSILIKQYSLNEESFTFWDQLRINSFSDASLYETQPLPGKGNMYNIDNPDNTVLGYFQVSSIKTKRIFITEVKDLELNYNNYCSPSKPDRRYSPEDYPIYFGLGGELNKECIFCTMQGGTTTKPEFWPY